MTINRALTPPTSISTAVIKYWNSMSNVAAVPPSRFPVERRHVIAALKSMTSQTMPDWDEAYAKIHYAIKAYADIRNDPGNYEHVNDRTLSQLLKWEMTRFLEISQPHMRLRRDKTRLPERDAEDHDAVLRDGLGKKYTTDDPGEIDCLMHSTKQDLAERCCDCKYEDETLRCQHPKWPFISKDYMNECFAPKEQA